MQKFIITLLSCSVTMSLLALFYMACMPLLKKRYSEKGRYYAWLIVLIGLIIPFRPTFNNALVKVDVPTIPTEINAPMIQIGSETPFALPIISDTTPSAFPDIPWWQATTLVWFFGVFSFLGYHAVKHYFFIKMVNRWSEGITEKRHITLLQSLKSEMGIKKQINLYRCSSVGGPMMVGFVKPRILLPQADFEEDELRFVLKHELVHYKRKDLYYKALVLIVTAVHWFNPIIYLMAKAIGIQCESSCDAETIQNADIAMRLQYSETIIGVVKCQSKLKTAFSTNFYGGKKGMKNRISSIMDMKKKKMGIAILCCILLFTIGTTTAFAFGVSVNIEQISENLLTNISQNNNSLSDSLPTENTTDFSTFGKSNGEIKVEIEWWTYDEYKDFAEEQMRLTESAKVTVNGIVVNDYETSYLNKLNNVENGVLYSKSIKVNGKEWEREGFSLTIPEDNQPFGVAIKTGSIEFSGTFSSVRVFLEKFKIYCDEQVKKGNLSRYNADVEYAIWETALTRS